MLLKWWRFLVMEMKMEKGFKIFFFIPSLWLTNENYVLL